MPVFSKQLGVMDYSSPEAVKSIANHLRVMQEELEYRLMFLDSSNINEINMEDTHIFSSKGGLLQLLNETDESIAKLSIRDDEITLSVEAQGKSISELKQTSDGIALSVQDLTTQMGHALKLDANGVYIVDAEGNTVTISGGQIDATNLNLTGRITFTDLDATTQNAINSAGGISAAEARTIITSTLVSSPNIQGATYWDADGEHKMQLSDPGDNYGTFRLYNGYYGSVPYFSINDNETGVTTLMAMGYNFLMVDDGMTPTTVKPYLTWDFSNADVSGLYLTFS